MSRVDLGFLEKIDPCLLKSHYFPSKVGGKPAWLNLKQLPTTEELQCNVCNQPMSFLCQVYAPKEEKDSCFHRTIFLFICRNVSCCVANENRNLIVLRSQLPRVNDFYSTEPPNEDEKTDFDIGKYVNICELCGCPATKHCSKCKKTSYCSREHQVTDWKLGHKTICGSDTKSKEPGAKNEVIFDEWELEIEEEDTEDTKKEETTEEADERRMKEYEKLVADGKAGTLTEVSDADLQSHAAVDEDKVFAHFRKRIGANPEQVLRYDRGGEPLWVAAEPKPTEIPPCEFCNGPRQFEFQILPQLLYQLHENTLDWGTLVVYTCTNSCDDGPDYKKEFIFKQDISNVSQSV